MSWTKKMLMAGLAAAAAVTFGLASSAHPSGTPQASISKPIMECPDPHATTWPC